MTSYKTLIRGYAPMALAHLPSERVVGALIAALEAPENQLAGVNGEVAMSLGAIRGAEAVEPFDQVFFGASSRCRH